jgi:peptidyl-tRNA hydrolase
VADWVLGRFEASEKAELPGVVTQAALAVERILEGGAAAAMNAINGAYLTKR